MKAKSKRGATLPARVSPATTPTLVMQHPSEQRSDMAFIGGSQSHDFNQILAGQVVGALWCHKGADADDRDRQKSRRRQRDDRGEADDGVEGMIAAQMVALHNASMECFRRAMIPEQPAQFRTDNLGAGNRKASRACADLLGALDKHRGKGGEQRVTVEHVHVNSGGQAIVGAVATGGAGSEAAAQPHAPDRSEG